METGEGAASLHPNPTAAAPLIASAPAPPPPATSVVPAAQDEARRLAAASEAAWLQVATLAEQANDFRKAADAYEHVISQNDRNVHALLQLASISRMEEKFEDAVGYLTRILDIDGPSGEVHGAIGHCYLTLCQCADSGPYSLECLGKCYAAYSEAANYLGAYNDPNLWYGIGLLYERYGVHMRPGPLQSECYQAAEDTLRSVLQAAPQFEKRSEVLYRLGMIHEHQKQPQQALECFQAICDHPPAPLSQADVWLLIGTVQEAMEAPAQEFAKQAYEHVLRLMQASNDPKLPQVYRQLGWVCHKYRLETTMVAPPVPGQSAYVPLVCLRHALESDPSDAQNWHLLGKCLLDHGQVDGAYDCLQHATALDPAHSEIWATVGSIYLARGQTSDAIIAFEHAVYLNPISSVRDGCLSDHARTSPFPKAKPAGRMCVTSKPPH